MLAVSIRRIIIHSLAVCGGVGVAFLVQRGIARRADARSSAAAAAEAGRLLEQYGKSLEKSAEASRDFSRLTLVPGPKAKEALGPLASAVVNMNNAYVKIEQRRALLSLQLLASSSPRSDDVACRLHASERFQWDDLRTKLNKLVVNLIIVDYDPTREETIAAIRKEQAHEWPALCLTLAAGARQFGNRQFAIDCVEPH